MSGDSVAPALEQVVPAELAGLRTDQALARMLPDHSRSRIQQWIREGRVRLDGKVPRPRDPVRGGEQVVIELPPPPEPGWRAEQIPLEVVFEDADIVVVVKPAGLVVHPGAGNPEGTLLNALLHRYPELRHLPRAGIVHRLDKDTSGLMVVARTERARQVLIRDLQKRRVSREYLAIVTGRLVAGGTVEAPIGRDRRDRKRMAVTARGKKAVSHYRVSKRYRAHTLLEVSLESGRTHQIRVHMKHLEHPLLGDPLYGGRLRLPAGATPKLVAALQGFRRQALHAARLALKHPITKKTLRFRAPPPADFKALTQALARDAAAEKSAGNTRK
jgi:23S rRNA pseudouridine1911/1915/1917 synthase